MHAGKKGDRQSCKETDTEQCETLISQSVYQKYGLTFIILQRK